MISAYKKILDGVVAKSDSRPVLKGVHYQNGNVVATDSHQLVLFKDVTDNKELDVTIDLSTYLPIDGNYPDTDRLIPTDNTTQLTFHNVDELTGVVNYLKAAKKQLIDMDIKDNGLSMELHDAPGMSYNQEVEWNGDSLDIRFNASYLYNALSYLDRLHKGEPGNYNGDITIHFNGQLRPFTIEYGKMVYLVCPVRNF